MSFFNSNNNMSFNATEQFLRESKEDMINIMTPVQLLKETELQYVDKDIKEAFEKLGYLNYSSGEPSAKRISASTENTQ